MVTCVVLFWLGSLLGFVIAVLLFSSKASDWEARRFFVLRELLRVIDSADSDLCSGPEGSHKSLRSLRNSVERVYNQVEEMQ